MNILDEFFCECPNNNFNCFKSELLKTRQTPRKILCETLEFMFSKVCLLHYKYFHYLIGRIFVRDIRIKFRRNLGQGGFHRRNIRTDKDRRSFNHFLKLLNRKSFGSIFCKEKKFHRGYIII